MPNIINVSNNCYKTVGNTKAGRCWNDLSIWKQLLFGPVGVDVPADTLANTKTWLEDNTLLDNGLLRVRPLQGIIGVEASGGDPQNFTEPATGLERTTGENALAYIIRYLDGGFCLSNRMRVGSSITIGIMVGMQNGKVLAFDSETPDMVQFIPFTFYALAAIPPVAQNEAPSYRVRITTPASNMNENSAILDFNTNGKLNGQRYLQDLTGLQDVVLYSTAARVTGVLHVGAKSDCGSVNMYDEYADALADVDAWEFVRDDTGAIVLPSAVVKDATLKGWTVTLTPNTLAVAGSLRMVGPTELAALTSPVIGFESDSLPL